MRTIVGLAGRMRCGKDTVADMLVQDYGFVKMAFATPLRDEVCAELLRESFSAEFPLEIQAFLLAYHRNLEAVWAKPTEPGMRRLLQWWGTEYRRTQDPDYWTKRAEEKLPDHGRYVFTDIRFQNECDLVGRLGGEAWKITRPNTGTDASGHISEGWCDQYENFDAEIDNSGTFHHLIEQIHVLMTAFKEIEQR